jgi:2,3-bisphosphoglycerate-dependent phosphoglycerate mutase
MTTRVTLVRHGQSTGNAANCFTGQTDVALSELGQQQAQLTAAALNAEKFTAIYASDLQRARLTAQAIAAPHQLPVIVSEQLREINLGDFQGQNFLDVERNYPREFAALSRRELDVTIPGGESHRAVRTRVIKAFDEIVRAQRNGSVLLVVHGGVIFHINHYILGIPEERCFTVSYRIGNCSIHRFELLDDDRWRVLTLNEEAHLRGLARSQPESEFQAISERLFGCSQ